MRILVTGGLGYIGSHTVVELLKQGFETSVIDNLSNSSIEILDRIEKICQKRPHFKLIDVTDAKALEQYLSNEEKFDFIIHFAALKSVGESVSKPLEYMEANVLGTLNILKVAQQLKCEGLIFSSSCTVYGSPKKLPVDESTPMGETPSPYGFTKQVCERMISDFIASQDEFKAVSLRYFNPLGAHESLEIGELPNGIPNNLLPYITQTAAGLRDELKVFGNDYNTPDGTAIRDYIHVSDVATAHVAAVHYLQSQTAGFYDFVNLGTGTGVSVLEVIQSFERTSGLKLPYSIVDRRAGDVEAIYADVQKAEKALKWKAQCSLDDMTRTAWNWEQKYRSSN